MWDHLPLEALQPSPPICGDECLMSIRYANVVHAQRKAYVETRLAELAVEDPTHYFADEWNALYDAAIDLHADPARLLRDVPAEVRDYTRFDHDGKIWPPLLSTSVRDEPIRDDGEPRGVRWTERVSGHQKREQGDNVGGP